MLSIVLEPIQQLFLIGWILGQPTCFGRFESEEEVLVFVTYGSYILGMSDRSLDAPELNLLQYLDVKSHEEFKHRVCRV